MSEVSRRVAHDDLSDVSRLRHEPESLDDPFLFERLNRKRPQRAA